MEKKKNISKRMGGIAVISVLLILVDFWISLVVIRDTRRQNLQYVDGMAEVYMEEQDRLFFTLSRQLLSILMGNEGTRQEINDCLDVLENGSDPLKINVAKAKMQRAFWEYTWNYGPEYHFFAFLEKNDLYVDLSADSETVPGMEEAILNLLKKGELDTRSAKAKWSSIELPSGSWVLKVMCSQGRYLGCFLKADELLLPLKEGIEGGFQVLLDEENRCVTGPLGTEQEKAIERYLEGSSAGIFSKYYVIGKRMERAPFCVLLFLDNQSGYETYFKIQIALMFLAAAIWGTLTFFVRYARRTEIALYENELNKNRIQMDYLQLQIKPHFYLNCLNFIYQMIDLGGYEEAKRMAVTVSDYLRYLFKNSMELVKIGSELMHVENYLKIQKMRYQDAFSYYIEQDEDTCSCMIPPLLIQTFVENAVRHSVSLDRSVEITIVVCAESNELGKGVRISISDMGEGFSGEVLRTLNAGGELAGEDGHRIGIANCLKRIHFFYGGKEQVKFYNNPAGGAVVDIYLPVSGGSL